MREPRRIVVVAPNWLGDAVMGLPAIADVRRQFPRSHLAVAARASVAGIFPLVPGINDVLTLEWRGQPLRRAARRADVERLRGNEFDVAILLPNSFAAAWMAARAGIPERWGYATDMRGPLLTRRARRPAGRVHQGGYYQHLVAQLGIANGPLEPAVHVRALETQAARDLLASEGWDGMRPLVAMAPGAAYGTAKRWLPSHFAKLATDLVMQRHATCVLVGSAADAATTGTVRESLPPEAIPHVIDAAGRTSLDVLAAVLSLAHTCVSNDSGVMHLAAAAGTPVAALFGPTREHETAPLAAPGGQVALLFNPVWCRPCMLRECPIDHRCMRGLEPERVFAAVARLMAGAAR